MVGHEVFEDNAIAKVHDPCDGTPRIVSARPIVERNRIWEEGGIDRWSRCFCIIHQGLQFIFIGQPPVGLPCMVQALAMGDAHLPKHDARFPLVPG